MTQTELFPAVPQQLRVAALVALGGAGVSACAKDVLRILLYEPAAGRENALQIRHLQARWRIRGQRVWSDRDVKAAVKELLEDCGVPIGSSRSGDRGYFLLVTPADIEAAERPLIGEIRSLARRLRAINPRSEISRAICGQLGLIAERKEKG